MIREKDFENILAKYPELIEEDLILLGQQVRVYGRVMDLLFEDKFKRKLIVELKIGPIKDQHIGQVLSYEGMLLSAEDPTIRVMLIGNRVPPNIQRSLDHHGIAWREISLSSLRELLISRKDEDFLDLFDGYDPVPPLQPEHEKTAADGDYKIRLSLEELVFRLKSSDYYVNFQTILQKKIDNEDKAKEILIANLGRLNKTHLNEIFSLVDEPYPYLKDGKISKGPWFGRLLKSNTSTLLEENEDTINIWYNILTDNSLSLEEKFEFLLNGPHKIRGLSVGFVTLMLYILDKKNYTIWFEGLHNGLTLLLPDLEKYSGASSQYQIYNDRAIKFMKDYGFDPTELDWILSTGIYYLDATQSTLNLRRINKQEQMSGEGTIDRSLNQFSSPEWIRQNRPLTSHRQSQLESLFNKDFETIRNMKPNEGSYVAFVAIRWGFATMDENLLIKTEKWKNKFNYDNRGNLIKDKIGVIPPTPKFPRATKKSVCLELISRKGGASLDAMAQAIVDRGIDPDFEKNKRTCRLWMSKIGVPVTKLPNGNYIISSLL